MHKVSFVSQKSDAKTKGYGCGVACLMMLLKRHCKSKKIPDYSSLAKELGAHKLPSKKSYTQYKDEDSTGAYVDDVMKWLSRNKFDYAGLIAHGTVRFPGKDRVRVEILERLLSASPTMVGVAGKSFPKKGHWIVLTNLYGGKFWYFDPLEENEKRKSMSKPEFYRRWEGVACAIFGNY